MKGVEQRSKRLHRVFTERLTKRTWQAQCSCGWRGPHRRFWGLFALIDADRHTKGAK